MCHEIERFLVRIVAALPKIRTGHIRSVLDTLSLE
jgi:hypothetical protein